MLSLFIKLAAASLCLPVSNSSVESPGDRAMAIEGERNGVQEKASWTPERNEEVR